MALPRAPQAVERVAAGSVRRALAVVRPPGHHAECDRATGFCIFNNAALAALAALQQPGAARARAALPRAAARHALWQFAAQGCNCWLYVLDSMCLILWVVLG